MLIMTYYCFLSIPQYRVIEFEEYSPGGMTGKLSARFASRRMVIWTIFIKRLRRNVSIMRENILILIAILHGI